VSKNKGQDENKDFLRWLEEEDPFGLNDEIITVIFECIDCGEKDEVPDYVVEEFAYDLKENEEVEVVCPFCEGAMRQARSVPSDK
jgi:hypothetical protein